MKTAKLLNASFGVSFAALASSGLAGPHLLETKDGEAPTSTELMEKIGDLGKKFADFQSEHQAELKELKTKGSVDPLTTEKMNKHIDEVAALQKSVDKLQLELERPPLVDSKGERISSETVDHQKGFDGYMRKGLETGLGELQQKALNVGTDADGGYAVPEQLDRNIHSLAKEISEIRAIANVVTVGTSDYKKLVNKRGTGATWQGETGTTADSGTPDLAQVVPTMGWLEARPRATQEMLDDSFFDVESWLAGEVATEFAAAEGSSFINGNGTNKPTGFLAGTAPVATADATRAFGALQFVASGEAAGLPTDLDAYIDLIYQLKASHRMMARWVLGSPSLASIMKLKTTDGIHLWQPSTQAGQPARFFGYGVTEAEDMPAIAANAFPVAFGNFKAGYTIVDRFGTRVQRDPFTAKPYTEFYTTKRVGGKVVDSEAIKLLKCAT